MAVLMLALPVQTAAQEGCVLGDGSTRVRTERDPRGGNITRLDTPHFECADGVEIWADSAVAYSIDAMSILFGSVRYIDRQRELRADNARYFSDLGRLQAQGRVFVTNSDDGSTVENGDLVYLRQTDFRDVEEMTVTTGSDGLRPRATVYPQRADPAVDEPADSTSAEPDADIEAVESEPAEPEAYIVVGDLIVFRGNSYFNATGTVEIERDSLQAFADSAEYTGDLGQLILDGSARVEGDAYDLVGRTITLASAADGSDEVHALRDAVLNGEDLRVTAPLIVLRLLAGEIDHMVAVPMPVVASDTAVAGAPPDSVLAEERPFAVSGDIQLTGDSLDLAAPDGAIERIFAAGTARSVSTGRPDMNVSSLPDLAQTDWIDADSIEVLLLPAAEDSTSAAADTSTSSGAYEVERIIARIGARSLYRLAPADSTAVVGVDPPAVSYMVADTITIFMVDGQADRVESVGQVSGWHLEPLTRPPADSLAQPAPAGAEPGGPPASIVPIPVPQDPADDNRGDGPLLGAYLSSAIVPQPWRLQ